MADRPVETSSPRRGIPVFRIAGIQIIIDYSWFIIFFLVVWSLSAGYFPTVYPGQTTASYWIAGSAATLLFFGSILAHELAHSLVAIRSGIEIPSITLFIFGGVSRLGEEARDPKTEFKIAIVGPLSSFVLAGLFWWVKTAIESGQDALVVAIFQYLAFINLALGIFNLVPGFPLDGGRVLRALWWWRTGSIERATKVASDMGKGFAVALMILGAVQIFAGALLGGIWLIFIGMFLRGVAEGGYQELVMRHSLEGVQVGEVMIHDVVAVPPDIPVRALVEDYFLKHGYRGYPVLRDGNVLGVVSLRNLKDLPEQEWPARTVRDVMTPLSESWIISPDAPLLEALKKMAPTEIGRLLVMKGDRFQGMVTKSGLMRLLEIRRVLTV